MMTQQGEVHQSSNCRNLCGVVIASQANDGGANPILDDDKATMMVVGKTLVNSGFTEKN